MAPSSLQGLPSLAQKLDQLMAQLRLEAAEDVKKLRSMMRGLAFDIARDIEQAPLADIEQLFVQGFLEALNHLKIPEILSQLKVCLGDVFSPQEAECLARVSWAYAAGASQPDFARTLLLAMFLLFPHRQPLMPRWQDVPLALQKAFWRYQFETAPMLTAQDPALHRAHLERTLASLWSLLQAPVAADMKTLAVDMFMSRFDGQYVMMIDENARAIMEWRYKIMDYIVRHHCQTDTAWQPAGQRGGGKIRLGLLAATMFAGTETRGMVEMIAGLDRERYDITLFCFGGGVNYVHDIHYYRDLLGRIDDIVRLPDTDFRAAIDLVRSRDLDLLWHMTHLGLIEAGAPAFMLMHKLARIQCSTTSYFAATTGNPHFQYVLTMAPSKREKTWAGEFTETEINIPGTVIYVPNNWRQPANRTLSKEGLGIPPEAIVYFAGAAATKYNGPMVHAWADILRQVPNSYLVLYPFNPGWAPRGANALGLYEMLQAAVAATGIDAARIKLLGHVNAGAISAMHRWGHVFLSSFPYGGVTSLSDALDGGLAPVTMIGKSMRCSGDGTVMAAFDLLDFVTTSPQEYIELAVRLGRDDGFRDAARAKAARQWQTLHDHQKQELAHRYAAAIDSIVAKEFALTAPAAAAAYG